MINKYRLKLTGRFVWPQFPDMPGYSHQQGPSQHLQNKMPVLNKMQVLLNMYNANILTCCFILCLHVPEDNDKTFQKLITKNIPSWYVKIPITLGALGSVTLMGDNSYTIINKDSIFDCVEHSHITNILVKYLPNGATNWSTRPILLALSARIVFPVNIISSALGTETWCITLVLFENSPYYDVCISYVGQQILQMLLPISLDILQRNLYIELQNCLLIPRNNSNSVMITEVTKLCSQIHI